jgi:hypothetical protein
LARNCSQQQVVNQPLFKRHGAVLSDPGEFDIDIQIFDADIFRLLKNILATAEIIKDPLLERILSGFNTGLGTGLALVGGATADADRADPYLVLSHDRQGFRSHYHSRFSCDAPCSLRL